MYPVVWSEIALDELADAVVRSDLPTQDMIEQGVLRLNARLARDPFTAGESRPAGYRIAYELPAGIMFRFDGRTATVQVTGFWTC